MRTTQFFENTVGTKALLGASLFGLLMTSCAVPVDGPAETDQRDLAVHDEAELEYSFEDSLPVEEVIVPEGAACGETIEGICEPGTFCKMPRGVCDDHFPPPQGTCESEPDVCSAELDPVCGCNGVTYGNECRAFQQGQAVEAAGFCEPASKGDPCGAGVLEPKCADGLYCALEPGACQDTLMGAQGTCEVPPTWCAQVWDPVCGCDGNTYGNACVAAAHGKSVAYDAPCVPAHSR